jgi:hypothetical protein
MVVHHGVIDVQDPKAAGGIDDGRNHG